MYLACNGIALYYEVKGSGKPLIMLHGNSEDHTIFDQAAKVLAKRYTCWLIDSRGHGKSEKTKELHYLDMAGDLISFMEQKKLRDAAVYGFSDGGIIGLLAAMNTDRISHLAVSGANCTPAGIDRKAYAAIRCVNAVHPDPMLRMMLEEPAITAQELSTIQAETLVLAGQHDLVLRRETDLIASSIPRSEKRILAAEGHGSYIVHNRKIGDLLFAWLSRTGF